jgi:hypothetical protein
LPKKQFHYSCFRRASTMCVTPKPLCAMTETDFGMARWQRMPHEDPLISELARTFGQPDLRLSVDPRSRALTEAEVTREAVSGFPPLTLNSKRDCSTTIV